MLTRVFLILLCGSTPVISTSTQGCSISLSTDIPEQSPVYLLAESKSTTYQLFKPTGDITLLPIGARLLLVCANSNTNLIDKLNVNSLELVCSGKNILQTIQNKRYQLRDLPCTRQPSSTLRSTAVPCANGKGLIQEIGFEYGINQFAHLFTVCYDKQAEHTFYTHNTLNGGAINYSIVQLVRRPFSAAGMSSNTATINSIYTIQNQLSRFERYFGNAQPYINKREFLARGHLTPDADMIFGYEQLATYYYVNAAPEFQIVNAGNWLRVENLARSLAAQWRDVLDIYNGYKGVLRLPLTQSPRNYVEIYLDDKIGIYAPEYYFKVILQRRTDSAIVMITLNNPYATEGKEFCRNVCAEAGLDNPSFANHTRGYTFCCALSDFKRYYYDLPANVTASKLLHMSKVHQLNSQI